MGIFDIFRESEEKKQARKEKTAKKLEKVNAKFDSMKEKNQERIEKLNKKIEESKKRSEETSKELKESIRNFNELRHTCPICGNKEDFTAFKNGYGVGKGLVGAAIFGPLGFTAGMIGQNKIYLVCNKCGHKMKV